MAIDIALIIMIGVVISIPLSTLVMAIVNFLEDRRTK